MHKKVLALIFSVLSFSLVFASNAKALTIGSLEPEYDSGAKIEINTPSDGNTFDVTFLAKNQNLTYRATITNNEAETIVITNLDLQTPNVDYLEYTFSGIAVGDKLAPGDSKEITLQISSNSNDTRTTVEDFKLSIHYHKDNAVNPNPDDDPVNPEEPLDTPSTSAPDTGANSQGETNAKNTNQIAFYIVVTIASVVLLIILLSNKKVKKLHAIIAVFSLSLSFFVIGGIATAEKDEVYTITGKVRFTNVYSISINPGAGLYNGESGVQTIECRDGERVIISDPTYATYNFTGWATNPQTTFTTDNEGHRILVADNNYELSAQWDEIYYNLTIDPNGGTYNGQTGVQVLPIRVGTTATLATPEKTGMNFVSWTKTVGDTTETITDMNINIEEDVTLTANYEDIYYDIIIDPNGGTYNGSTTTTTEHVKYGTELTIADPSYNTYTFAGWDINPTATMNGNILTAYNNYTLTAQWEEIYYNLTINPNGGIYNENTETQIIPYRAGATAQISTPSKTGTTFSNWTKTIGSTSEVFTGTSLNMTSDITLTANYEDIYFDVTINPNGGIYNENTASTTEHVKYGTELTIPNPTYDTYRFAGWNIMPSTTLDGTTLTVYDNYTLTAQWEEIYYTLTINPNGGTYNNSTDTQETLYRAGATTENIATPSKEGMSFTNWTKTIGDTSEAFTGSSLVINSDVTLSANYEDLYFDVTVNPNGGKFNNSTEVYSTSIKYGSTLDLTSIERENYTLTNWTMNTNDSLPSGTNSIQIYSNLTLVANWAEIAYYTITINPNGGTYANSTDPTVVSNVQNYTTFNIGETSYDGYALQYWEVTSGTVNNAINGELTASSFLVLDDVTLTAHWGRSVARIERTQNIYGSIMAAEGVAEEDDIITLLVDTEETVTNDKKVTLDLNNHTVTGSLTNTTSGNITIINGEINNPSGAAVTNDGTLTLGINDYNDDGTANILNDNVRLVGTTAGLLQTNDTYKFYYYDGYLEGSSSLIGGYDGSPFYRNTFDDVVIYYYPLVNHVEQDGRTYQHTELDSSDRAVSKTSVHGDIYYYNLQDNINTSLITGYKIYAVRNFDAGYTLNIPANKEVTLDLDGFSPTINDTVTINGTFTIENGKGRGAGSFRVSQTIQNPGHFIIRNASVSGTTTNDVIRHSGVLTMENGYMKATEGYVLKTISGAVYELDSRSSLYSESSSRYGTVLNQVSDFVWDTDGTIEGYNIGLRNNSSFTLKKGTISGDPAIYASSSTTIDGGRVRGSTGIYSPGGRVTINDGLIDASYGVELGNWADLYMNGGTIKSTIGVYNNGGNLVTMTINGGTINATRYGVSVEEGTWAINGGTIYGGTYGVYANDVSSPVTIGDRTTEVSITNPEITGGSYALYGGSFKFYDGILHGPKAFQDNVIKAMPEGKEYYIEASDEYAENCWLVDHDNYLSVNGQEYNTLAGAYAAVNSDSDIIEVIKDMDLLTDLSETPSNKNITIDLAGHTIGYTQPLVNNGNLTMMDSSTEKTGKINNTNATLPLFDNKGTLTIDGGEYTGKFRAANNTGTIIINDGTLKLSNDGDGFEGTVNGGRITMNGGQILSDTITVERANLVMNGGTIKTDITGRISGAITSLSNTDLVLNDGLIEVISSTGTSSATAIRARYYNDITINGGTVRATTSGPAAGSYAMGIEIDKNGSIDINGGLVEVSSQSGKAEGIYNLSGGEFRMTGGKIDVKGGGSGIKYGLSSDFSKNGTITGGEIHASNTGSGKAYGIYTSAGTITIGTNDDTIDTDVPEITGKTYALHGVAFYFFDGVLRGKTGAYEGDIIKATPDGSKYHIESSSDYAENCWLEEAEKFLQVGDEEFSSFSAAYNAITGNAGTIKLIADTTIESEIPATPSDKTVTFDMNGHQLTHSQPLINGNSLIIIDSSDEKTGRMQNTNASAATIKNDKNLTIESGYLSSAYRTIENTGTVTINGGTINSENVGIYSAGTYDKSSTVNITGGLITLDNNTSTQTRTGISINNYTTVNITGGGIIGERNDPQKTYNQAQLTGISGKGTVNIDVDENYKIKIINARGSAYGIHQSNITMNNGEIIVSIDNPTNGGSALGIYDSTTTNLNNVKVDARGTGSSYVAAVGAGNGEIKNSNIYAYAEGIQGYCTLYEGIGVSGGVAIKDGTNITTESAHSNAISIIGKLNVSGGTITAHSDECPGYAEASKGSVITGGTFNSSAYGLKATGITTVGNNDSNISTTTPTFIGGEYGLYGDNGFISFYDGLIKGGTDFISTGAIATIPANTAFNTGEEEINGETYKVAYIGSEQEVAIIGDTKYHTLNAAISAVNTGETIEILQNVYQFETITIPTDKEFTIETNGHTIKATHGITNNGKLTITNSSDENPIHEYNGQDQYFIVNNEGAEITLNKMQIHSKRNGIQNLGTMLIDNVSVITAKDSDALANSAVFTAQNNSVLDGGVRGSSCASTTTINNSSISHTSSSVNGELNIINNSTVTDSSFGVYQCGVMKIDSSTFTLTNSDDDPAFIILNQQGNVTISNSTLTNNRNYYSSSKYTTVYNAGGTVTATDSTFIVDITNSHNATSTIYGIYNASGYFYLKSGTVITRGEAKYSYGIYVDYGIVTIGEAESPDSPNYGLETADVSTTDPLIKAETGSQQSRGIMIKNSSCKVYFYDGKIMGKTYSMQQQPTGTEYLYETKATTEDGYKVLTLEWMRQQP